MNYLVDDIPAFLADFGTDAVADGVVIRGLFDQPPAEAFGMVGGNQPSFMVAENADVYVGLLMVISGRQWHVVNVEKDYMGFAILRLEQVLEAGG